MDHVIQAKSILKKMEVALVVDLYSKAKIGFIASIICSTIVLFYLYFLKSSPILPIWYFLFMLVTLFRFILVVAFNKDSHPENHLALWCNLFIIGAFFGGLTWGVIGTDLLLPKNGSIEQMFVIVILAGISAGAVPLLAAVRRAAVAFLIPALAPLILHFISMGMPIYTLFNIALIVFLLYLMVLSFKTHDMIRHSFYLYFENDVLLKQLEISNKSLALAATHDPLTHVANRALFETHLKEVLERAKNEKTMFALFYLDLDHFKEVNDIYGHSAGDQLLLIVVARIKNIVREKDFVSRLGGDELTVILENINDLETISDIANRLCLAVSQPIRINQDELHVEASIGISLYPFDGKDMDTLLTVADEAMYYVKEHGGNSFHFNVQLEHT